MYRNELRLYYLSKGLKGKHLKAAIRMDVRRIRKNHADPMANCHASANVLRMPVAHNECIGGLFVWRYSREGYEYWAEREQVSRYH